MSKTYGTHLYPYIDQIEKEHFWFRARKSLCTRLIKTTVRKPRGKTFLEIGCGTGALLSVFTNFGFRVTGMDVNMQALSYAKKQSQGARLLRTSLASYKTKKHYDAIGIFDILEHQKNDESFLRSSYKLLKKGGYLFISVPAHQWLWNSVDEMSGHVRRYEKTALIRKLKKAGFSIDFYHYWNFLLLGWYILWRWQYLFDKRKSQIKTYVTVPPRPINVFFRLVLELEEQLFFSVPFPAGSSLIVVARKK